MDQANIIYSWLTTGWTGSVLEHPGGNPWHYALAPSETNWGGDWGRDKHPNYVAGREGMDFLAREQGCSNGRNVEFKNNDPHIAAGLVRNRKTKEVFRFPDGMKCFMCGRAAFDESRLERSDDN